MALGIGDSTVVEEQKSYGIPFPKKAQRLALLDETIRLIREISPATSIWIGGTAPELLERADRVDGMNFWVSAGDFEKYARQVKDLPDFEVSWSGERATSADIGQAVRAGASHIILPAGLKNYRDRIAFLAEERLAYE